ncbi:MAG: hypothetical protein Q8N91_04150 [Candidatus Omnitrophota bacterium]|nr:hypothetical protein [Candidatus Omnitrophota bacterium]
MNRFNGNMTILNRIYAECERTKSTTEVGPDHYKSFLKLNPKGMELLIKVILVDRADSINKMVASGTFFKDDNAFYKYITDYLEMIILGMLGVNESKKLVFSKPIGHPPDPKTEVELDKKIKDSIPIIEKVVQASLRRQGEQEYAKGEKIVNG